MNINQIVLNKQKEEIDALLYKMHNKTISDVEYQKLQQVLITHYILEYQLNFFNKEFVKDEYLDAYPICEYPIKDNKLLFISDTHLGSRDENQAYIDFLANYVIKNNIRTVIHAGDFIEGQCRAPYLERNIDDLKNELYNAIELWPKEFTTQLLLGNHDFSSIKYPDLIDALFGLNNIKILGMGQVLLDWNDLLIRIKHQINQISFERKTFDALITLKGHSHLYYSNPDKKHILIPPLCNDIKDSISDLKTYGIDLKRFETPIFIEGEFVDENTLLLKEVSKRENIISYSEETLINTRTREMKKYGR